MNNFKELSTIEETELQEYYYSEIHEQWMPPFEDLKHWQRSQMVNGGHFNRWRARKSFKVFIGAFFNTFRINHFVRWICQFVK